jgi:hypothetical protein
VRKCLFLGGVVFTTLFFLPKRLSFKKPIQSEDLISDVAAECGIKNQKQYARGLPRTGDDNPDNAWKLRNYCRMFSLEAVEKVAQVMRCQDSKLALTAAAMILDRAWGKPIQQMEVGQPGDFTDLSDRELEEFIKVTQAKIDETNKTKH